MNGLKGRLTYANVASTVALFLAIGGGAYAAASASFGAGGSLRLCISAGGVMRAERPGARCPRSQKAVEIDERGPRGLPGQPGPPGAAVVARIRSTGSVPLTTDGSFAGVSVAGASWTQPADASEWAFGEATFSAPATACGGGQVQVQILGSTSNGIALQASDGVAAGSTATVVIGDTSLNQQIAFEPGRARARNATFQVGAGCLHGATGPQAILSSLAVDVAQVS
jgi:hypothetical protein